MKILNLHVGAFGKFKDFDLAPAEGLNIYCRENEFGKTTLIYFIYYMFYGYEAKLLKPYLPWSGEDLSGRLEFEAGGRRWRIERHRPAKGMEKKHLHCLDTGEELMLSNKDQPGPRFLELDGETFLRSFCITQGDLRFDRTDGLDVALKNMAATGDENVSFSRAAKYLEDLRVYYKHIKGQGGFVPEREAELTRGREEEAQLRAAVDHRLAERKQWEALAQGLSQKEEQIRTLTAQYKAAEGSDALKLLARLDALKELPRAEKPRVGKQDLLALEQAFARKEEARQAVRPAEDALTLTRREQQMRSAPGGGLLPVILLVLGAVAGIAGVAIPFWPCYLLAGGFAIAALVIYLTKNSANAAAKKQGEGKILEAQAALDAAKSAYESADRAWEDLRGKYRVFSMQEVKDLQIAWGVYEGANTEESLALQEQAILAGRTRADLEALAQGATETDQTAAQVHLALTRAQGEREQLRQKMELLDHRDLQQLWDRLTLCTEANMELEHQIAEGRERLSIILQTMQWLKEANEEMNTHFAPQLCKSAGQVLSALTGGKYSGLLMDEKFSIKLEAPLGTHEAEHFSAGTRDAVYFAFRLAVGEMLGKEPLPMVLDDPFTNLDPTRHAAAMDLLKAAAKDRQILYFSCREEA